MSKKSAPKPRPGKPRTVYFVARPQLTEDKSFSEPDRVFGTKAAAEEYAAQLNREVRELTNPFAGEREAGWMVTGGERKFGEALKKLGVAPPKPPKAQFYDWEGWWDRVRPELTEAQREGVWDALDKYEWFAVRETTLED